MKFCIPTKMLCGSCDSAVDYCACACGHKSNPTKFSNVFVQLAIIKTLQIIVVIIIIIIIIIIICQFVQKLKDSVVMP
jgi:hypothetical protein